MNKTTEIEINLIESVEKSELDEFIKEIRKIIRRINYRRRKHKKSLLRYKVKLKV